MATARRQIGYVSTLITESVPLMSYGTATGGSSSSITVDGVNYTLLTFSSTSTLTITKAGLFDLMICGSGGGGAGGAGNSDSERSAGGGGAGGMLLETGVYIDANVAVTIGAGGASNSTGNSSSVGGTSPSATVSNISAIGGGTGGRRTSDNSIPGQAGASGGGGGGSQTGVARKYWFCTNWKHWWWRRWRRCGGYKPERRCWY